MSKSSADKILPAFVRSRVDHAVRVGLLDHRSTRMDVLAAISSPAADQYIDAALGYLLVRFSP